jgi:hydrogenase maturation protease
MKKKGKILVLGIGNEVLMDDGIGPKLVKKLKNFLPVSSIDYATSLVGGMEIIEIMRGYRQVVIIDGIMTGENPPGTVLFMDYPVHKNTLHLSNAHDISFEMSVSLARQLGIPFPKKICIIAVEIIEDRVFGERLTAPLQEKYSEIFSSIAKTIQENLDQRTLEDCYEKI